MDLESLRAAFAARFRRPCTVVSRAPGRVNLIGEHTDYNDGYVLPIATGQSTWVAAAAAPAQTTVAPARDGGATVRVFSANMDEEQDWWIGRWRDEQRPHWTSYVAGVVELLRQHGVLLGGFDALIHSDVPVGSGLSSSAALSVSMAMALTTLADAAVTTADLAALCRQAEHQFAGVPCGFMDQYASLASHAGTALLLDCRSLTYEHVPLPLSGHVILVVDSGVRHELASGEYAKRQQQCHEALAFFRKMNPGVRALRDVDSATVRAHVPQMPPLAAARGRHVTSENERTLAAAVALRRGDLAEMGRLMRESHRSLRDDYEVSCAELDLLVDIVSRVPGVLGARMTGGGFGGSIVALAHRASVARVADELGTEYDTPARHARLFEVHPGAGATIEWTARRR